MNTYYKATRPDGRDFYSGTVDYATALATGEPIRVRTPEQATYSCCTPDVLHASDVPTEALIGGSWPCRLFVATGRPVAQEGHKFGFRSLVVVREVEGWRALGPQGDAIAALIERARTLTYDEGRSLDAAWDAAWDAARDAARALVVHDLIGDRFTQAHYDLLTRPWASVIGPVHPDDQPVTA